MKNWNFFHWLLLIIGIFILTYIFSPSVRGWICNLINTKFKKNGDKCTNCITSISGIIVDGDCVPELQVIYDKCIQNNTTLKDGEDCIGCGINSSQALADDFSGNGIIINGKCTALPDAFAGKICVPSSAPVNPSPLSYKRVLISGTEYKYYKNDGSTVSQGGASLADIEIMRSDYVSAFVQSVKPCPTGQIKV